MFTRSATTAVVLSIALLSGCSTRYWTKPGATQQDLRTDYSACEDDARFAGFLVRPLQMAKCMNARGYEVDSTACQGEIAGIQVQCSAR